MKFFRLAIILTVAVNLITPQPLGALSSEQRRVLDSGAAYFDIEDTQLCGSETPGAQLSPEDNIGVIFNYLVNELGFQDFQAAGILGNMSHESGFEPLRLQYTFSDDDEQEALTKGWVTKVSLGDGGRVHAEDINLDGVAADRVGWGLVQWTPPGKIITPLLAEGKNPDSLQAQLDFLFDQLEGRTSSPEKAAGDALKATTDVAEATLVFETKYERHSGPPQSKRIVEAQSILDQAREGGYTGSIASAGCSGSSEGQGSAVATALEYSWPNYRGKGFVEKKPAYEQAVDNAKADGRYVGGRSYPGVDCGGFVTLVMVNSGYEPDYNSGGRGGNTVSQQAWTDENWEKIGSITSTAELQAGDVAFTPGHTFMFVGDNHGFETDIASASLDERAPMAGKESVFKDSNGNPVTWYRKK